MKSRWNLRSMLVFIVTLTLLVFISQPAAASMNNGSFETGDFTGWSSYISGFGTWRVVPNIEANTWGCAISGLSPNPSDGTSMALADMGMQSTLILWQDV